MDSEPRYVSVDATVLGPESDDRISLVIGGIVKRLDLGEVDGIKVYDADDEFPERFERLLVDNCETAESIEVVYTTREEENRQVQTIPEELIPEVWAERQGVKITDREGWKDKSFYEPITHEEFQQRVILCATESVPPIPAPTTEEEDA